MYSCLAGHLSLVLSECQNHIDHIYYNLTPPKTIYAFEEWSFQDKENLQWYRFVADSFLLKCAHFHTEGRDKTLGLINCTIIEHLIKEVHIQLEHHTAEDSKGPFYAPIRLKVEFHTNRCSTTYHLIQSLSHIVLQPSSNLVHKFCVIFREHINLK